MNLHRTALIAALSLLAVAAEAQTDWSDKQQQRVDQRQERQTARIGAGIQSGQLTRREQLHLEHQQAKTARIEQRIEADGKVSGKEALRLEQRQDHNSRAIRRAKHDAQTRP